MLYDVILYFDILRDVMLCEMMLNRKLYYIIVYHAEAGKWPFWLSPRQAIEIEARAVNLSGAGGACGCAVQ